MSHKEFNHLLDSLAALSPEQMQQLYRELESKMAAAPVMARPVASETAPLRKPIWERIIERAAAIPDEEFDKLPLDGAEQHDHYIYGTPKRPPAS